MIRSKQYLQWHSQSGFTLVELLISMAIFAILSILAYGGLDSVIKSKTQTEEAMLRLNQLQLTMTKLHRDLEQLTPRKATDELGGTLLKLSAGQGDDLLIQFTRNGWRNPAKLIRSHLQRVAYKLDEEKLIRMSWSYVDRAQDNQVVETLLMDNLKGVQLRFLDSGKNWHDNWPKANADPGANNIAQPQAIEITLQMNDWGDITRIFRVPADS
jgi:general secretion pathway protein J